MPLDWIKPLFFLPLLVTSSTAAVGAEQNLFCDNPVVPHISANELLKKYKGQAKLADVPYGDVDVESGVSLFPENPRKTIDVYFDDETLSSTQRIETRTDPSDWVGPAGLHVGSTLTDVLIANGGVFKMTGLGGAYSGMTVDWLGGNLAKMPKGCNFSITFAYDDYKGVPDFAIGGDKEFVVDEKYFSQINVTVGYMVFWWDTPQ